MVCAGKRPSFPLRISLKTFARDVVPRPGIGERLRLRAVFAADVVVNLEIIAVGIERRVDIAKVNRFVLEVAAQNFEIVAVKKLIGHFALYFTRRNGPIISQILQVYKPKSVTAPEALETCVAYFANTPRL